MIHPTRSQIVEQKPFPQCSGSALQFVSHHDYIPLEPIPHRHTNNENEENRSQRAQELNETQPH